MQEPEPNEFRKEYEEFRSLLNKLRISYCSNEGWDKTMVSEIEVRQYISGFDKRPDVPSHLKARMWREYTAIAGDIW